MPNSIGSLDQSQSLRELMMLKRSLLRQWLYSHSEGLMPYSLWRSGSRKYRALSPVPTLTWPSVRPQRLSDSFGEKDLGRSRGLNSALMLPWTCHVTSAPTSLTVSPSPEVVGPENPPTHTH